MQKHIENYLTAKGLTKGDYIPCEICNSEAVDIHHIIFRSKFGKKRKHLQDLPNNLIALCRKCHNRKHHL